jgi:integrase
LSRITTRFHKAILDHLGSSPDERLFPISHSALSIAFKEALERARITDFRVHDLRHSFASHLLMAGSDLATVNRLMGHAGLAMRMRYAHLSQRHEADAVAKLDSKLAETGTHLRTKERNLLKFQANRLLAAFM